MEKIKVAVCFSGLLRTFKTCRQGWCDNLFKCNKDFSFDVFFHTWDIKGNSPKVDKFIELYKPLSDNAPQVKIDKPMNVNIKSVGSRGLNSRQKRWAQGLKSIQLCNKLKNDSNIEYPLVMRVRTDGFMVTPLNLNKVWDIVKDNSGTIAGKFKVMSLSEGTHAPLDDRVFFGDQIGMDYMCNAYNYLESHGCRTGSVKVRDSCEKIIHRHVFGKGGKNLNIVKHNFGYHLIIREDGEHHKVKFDRPGRPTKKDFCRKYPRYCHLVKKDWFE